MSIAQPQHFSNLLDQFIFTAQRAAATVEIITNSPESLKRAIQKNVRTEEKALLAQPDDLPVSLFKPLEKLSNIITDPTEEQMANIKIGITDCFAGIARTGSICVSISKSLASSVSLYTREHIAVLNSQYIVHRPRDIFSPNSLEGKGLNRNFVFITGTSATADMGPLVRGVHGPGKLHIIILD